MISADTFREKRVDSMKKNTKTALWVLAGGFLLALAVRIFQIIACTDMNTGFLYHDNNFFEDYGFYVIALLAAAGALFGAIVDSRRSFGTVGAENITDGRAAAVGFAMLLTGMCAAYEGYTEMKALSPSKFIIFVDFAFGAAMVVVAFITLYQKEFKPALGFSYAAAALYFTLRGVTIFLERMVITTVPEYLIECLCVIGGGVFFMLLAKFLSGNGQKNTKKALCAWGVPVAVMSLASTFATIISGFIAPSETADRITASRYEAELYYQTHGGKDAYMLTYTPWVIAAMGVFIAVVLIVLFMEPKPAEEASSDEEPQDETASDIPEEAEPAEISETSEQAPEQENSEE